MTTKSSASRYYSLYKPPEPYPNPQYLYNQNAINKEMTWVCEGITDTITAVSCGLKACGTIGQYKVDPYLFSHCRLINIIADNDPSGRKHAREYGLMLWKAQSKGEVNLFLLPPRYKDLNNYICDGHTVEELTNDELQNEDSKIVMTTAVRMFLRELSERLKLSQIDSDELESLLDMNVYPYLLNRGTFAQDSYIEEIRTMCNIAKEMSRKKMKMFLDGDASMPTDLGDESGPVIHFLDLKNRTLALDFFEDQNGIPTAYYTTWLQSGGKNELIRNMQDIPKTLVVQPHKTPQLCDIKNLDIPAYSKQFIPEQQFITWEKQDGKYTLQEFINGNTVPINGYEVYEEIIDLLTTYIWVPDARDHTLFAVFTIFTYLHPVFGVTPYLHLLGPQGTGKTAYMNLMRCLCFNSISYTSLTLAHVVRIPATTRGTSMFDDASQIAGPGKLSPDKEAIRDHLRVSYKPGFPAMRMDESASKEGLRKSVVFESWAPAILSSRTELELNISDRCLVCQFLPAPMEILDTIPNATADEKWVWGSKAQEIRNKLHTFVMQNFQYVMALARIDTRKYLSPSCRGREYEKWYPIFGTAMVLDYFGKYSTMEGLLKKDLNEVAAELMKEGKICNSLIGLQEKKVLVATSRMISEEPNLIVLIRTLEAIENYQSQHQDMFTDNELIWVPKATVRDTIADEYKMSSQRISSILRTQGNVLIDDRNYRFPDGQKRGYQINLKALKEKIASHKRERMEEQGIVDETPAISNLKEAIEDDSPPF